MGVKIGAGGGPPYPSDSPGALESSGRLQVYESKDFPFLHTGKSLVFVIARNGMVWGKRLDVQSCKGDIELGVFWPREDGCLLRIKGYRGISNPITFTSLLNDNLPLLSQSQRDKIRLVLSQKEIIQYELGTLMVRPGTDTTDHHYKQALPYRRMDKLIPILRHFSSEPCNIKVVDCSYLGNGWLSSTNPTLLLFRYDDASAKFQFYASSLCGKYSSLGTAEAPVNSGHIKNIESEFDNLGAKVVKRYFASQLSGRKFDMSGLELRSNVKIKPSLRIMYGEHDFFEYFEIDDAFLLLEEETISADFPKLYWTLGIAQNKHVREMRRLASNNPDLFAPILPETQRRVGGGVTDTV